MRSWKPGVSVVLCLLMVFCSVGCVTCTAAKISCSGGSCYKSFSGPVRIKKHKVKRVRRVRRSRCSNGRCG